MCRCASRPNSWPSPKRRLLFIRFLSCPGGALWCFCVREREGHPERPCDSPLSYSDIIFDITLGATKRSARVLINGRPPAWQRHTSPSFVSRLTLSLKKNTWTDVREKSFAWRAVQDNKWSHGAENKDRVLFCALARSRRQACQLQQVIDGLFNSVRSIGKFYLLFQ